MTYGQKIELGPFSFTVVRIVIAAGVVRAMLKGERLAGRVNGLDKFVLAWAGWAVLSSIGHQDFESALVYRLGMVYDSLGIYFLIRIFCQSIDDVVAVCRIAAIVLVPVAIEMLHERLTGRNLFAVFGGVADVVPIREGRIRAQGPFGHSILAGTVGAVCLPLLIGLWKENRRIAVIGLLASLAMIFASSSSGPILSMAAGIFALFVWRYRHLTRGLVWLGVLGYVALDLVMNQPAYFLLARIDLAGGSTGWHRAQLIQSAFMHLDEWWAMGTDFTRHWMPTGVSWNPDHTDITNHYILMGVHGGLPLMLLFIGTLLKGFSLVGQTLRQLEVLSPKSEFLIWAMGASLFAQAATFMSVAYFDQSFVFLYMTLAAIGSTWSWSVAANAAEGEDPAAHISVDLVPTAASGPQELGYPPRPPW
jgi:hypothetical protein